MSIQTDPNGQPFGRSVPTSTHPIPARLPIVIPTLVLVCTLGLIAWSAWPVLRPIQSIEVAQAVFVRSDVSARTNSTQSSAAQASDSNSRSNRTVQAAGWLEAEPFVIAATALADGVVEEMLVLEGDQVRAGQVLARMVDEDARLRLAHAQARLDQAQADRLEASAQLEAAQRNWDAPFELERAAESARATLAQRRSELAQLPALIRVEEALLDQVNAEHESVDEAYRAGASTELELITARAQASAQNARLAALRDREPILQAGIEHIQSELRAAERALELRIDDRARLDTAAARVASTQGIVAQRQADMDEAQLELDRMTIHAPIAGYIQRRFKSPGDKVIQMMDDPYSAHIAHIYDPARLQVRVDVPLADAAQVFVGQRCEVVVEVLPDRTFVGEVLRITHEADLQKNTIQVKVGVRNPEPVLRPEMLTRVKFLPTQSSGQSRGQPSGPSSGQAGLSTSATVRVPSAAIQSSGAESVVWLITDRANGRGVLHPITVMPLNDASGLQQPWTTVVGDLQPGALIALDPDNHTPGQRVKLRISREDAS